MFSTGLSSGALGGKGRIVMLSGTWSLPIMCQPAGSIIRSAWAPGATWAAISSRCSGIMAVLQRGTTRPTPHTPLRTDGAEDPGRFGPLIFLRHRPGSLARPSPLRAFRVEAQHPVPDNLKRDPADPGHLKTLAPS